MYFFAGSDPEPATAPAGAEDATDWLPIPANNEASEPSSSAEGLLRRRRHKKQVSFGISSLVGPPPGHEEEEDDADLFHHSLQHVWPLVWVEEKTGFPRFYQAVILVLVSVAATVYYLGGLRCCNLFSFIYPAFETLKALEHQLAKQEIFWLCYWCMYAVSNLFDLFLETTHLTWILPDNYYAFKAIFYLWAALPQTKGGQIGFRYILRPMFSAHQDDIDRFLTTLQRHCRQIFSEVRRGTSQILSAVVVSTLTTLHQGGLLKSSSPADGEKASDSEEVQKENDGQEEREAESGAL